VWQASGTFHFGAIALPTRRLKSHRLANRSLEAHDASRATNSLDAERAKHLGLLRALLDFLLITKLQTVLRLVLLGSSHQNPSCPAILKRGLVRAHPVFSQTVSPSCLRAVEGHWPANKVILFSCLLWSDPAGAVLHACWLLSFSFFIGIDCVRSFVVCLRLRTPPTGFHDLGFEVGPRRLRDPVGAV
jgi:hypothetical protein